MVTKLIVTIGMILIFVFIHYLEIKRINNPRTKASLTILLFVLFLPIIILLLDMWNYFDNWLADIYHSMTDRYDMLAFLGSYLSAIVSSILLLIITANDREENTKIIQNAQRPYLDVRFVKFFNSFLKEDNTDNTIFYHRRGNIDKNNLDEFVGLEIINQGESVAIIDINNLVLEIKYNYFEKDKNEVIIEKSNSIIPNINTGLPRLSLGKGKSITIIFLYEEFYSENRLNKTNISYSKITYRDLFNKQYIDECEIDNNGQQIVIQDNKEYI